MTEKPGRTAQRREGVVLEDVAWDAQGREIIAPLSLHLTEHRIGIVGRNGSGKSTLARLICGLIEPREGRVAVDGVDMVNDRKSAVTAAGILFQNPDHQIIFPTVGEEIAFGLTQLGQKKAEARESARAMLSRFDKPHWYDRAVYTLSQGQRHLVCLMAVLVMRPRLIVLDEPFAGLDIPTTRAMTAHLAALDEQIIQITHDPATLAGYDRVIWLEEGRVEMDGAPGRVLTAFLEKMEADDARSDLTG